MFEIRIHASGSKGNAYSIIDGDHKILIDPGIQFRELRKACSFKLSIYDFCLLSHEHKDHSKSIPDLMRIGFNIAMSQATAVDLGIAQGFIHVLKSERMWECSGWQVMPFSIQHDAADPLGFLIQSPSGKKICYATDTYYIQYNFPGVTHWMIECNYSEEFLQKNSALPNDVKRRIRTSHFELKNCVEFFKAQDLTATEAIHLIHLSDDNSDAELFRQEIEKAIGKPVYV